ERRISGTEQVDMMRQGALSQCDDALMLVRKTAIEGSGVYDSGGRPWTAQQQVPPVLDATLPGPLRLMSRTRSPSPPGRTYPFALRHELVPGTANDIARRLGQKPAETHERVD